MHKLLRAGILIILGMLIICTISGCSDDDPPEKIVDPPQLEDDTPPRPTITVIVDPPPNSYLDQNLTEFTLQFSEEVVGVTVNDTTATGFGLTWKVALHMMPLGPGQALNIKWVNQDGSMDTIDVGPYWIFFDDGGRASLHYECYSDRWEQVDVDPAPINAGGFRFDFDEDITGAIKLTDEGGVDLNWIGKGVW